MEKTKPVTINAVPLSIVRIVKAKAKAEGLRLNEAWVCLLIAGLGKEKREAAQ